MTVILCFNRFCQLQFQKSCQQSPTYNKAKGFPVKKKKKGKRFDSHDFTCFKVAKNMLDFTNVCSKGTQ